jgi:membrane protein implicated in regulation of membrane protease activity
MFKILIGLAASVAAGFGASYYLWEHEFYVSPSPDALAPSFLYAFLAYMVCRWIKVPAILARTAAMIAMGMSFYVLPETYYYAKFTYAFGFFAVMFIIIPHFFSSKRSHKEAQANSGSLRSFEGKRICLYLDLEAGTARLVVRKPSLIARKINGVSNTDKSGAKVEETMPIFQLRLEKFMFNKQMKENYVPGTVVITGTGPLASGTTTPGGMMSYPTGITAIEIGHRGAHKVPSEYSGVVARDGSDDAFVVRLFDVPNSEADRFKGFIDSIRSLVEAEYKKFHDQIAAEDAALRAERRIASEKAEAEAVVAESLRQEQLRQQAAATILQMLNRANMKGDFQDAQHDDGKVDYLIAADRSGTGLVAVGDDIWSGSFQNAKATIIPANQADRTANHLEIELQDQSYESEHLKKRRMRVMHGAPSTKIQEWCDRVNILSSQQAAA